LAKISKLRDEEIAAKLAEVPGWSLRDGKLHRELVFADFTAAFGFMARVALHAERRDHHPEWSNVYNRVSIDLTTHDAGGISERDFELARVVNELTAERA